MPLVKGSWPSHDSFFGVVVNDAFVRQCAGVDVTGRRLGGFILNDTVTGVVADLRHRNWTRILSRKFTCHTNGCR